jgi:HD-GYP domain-containing protein (c-di-GMP phosphodiesterase class II)
MITAEAIKRQILTYVGDYLEIYCNAVDQGLSPLFQDTVVLISSKEILEEINALDVVFISCQQIIATRVPDHNQLYKLLDIQSGERTIVINDSALSAAEGLQALDNFGFGHLKAVVWYPSLPVPLEFKDTDVAVIFGEEDIVPLQFKRVINLETRVVDHLSMIKLMMAVEIEDHRIQTYSNDYYKQAFEHVTLSNQQKKIILEINSKIENSYFETVKAIALAVDAKDSYTGGHCERVMNFSVRIGEMLKLDKAMQNILKFSSILHDVGKIGIPDDILNKPGDFSEVEYDVIKTHSLIGSDIVGGVDFLKKVAEVIKDHHERPDGKGYPQGKVGSEIELLARIIAIADAYDAMTSSRSYRPVAYAPMEALEELKNHSGTQFDVELVEMFVKIIRETEGLPHF